MRANLIGLFCLLLFTTTLPAQNLVPNPSFENLTQCPWGFGNNLYLAGWSININTADLHNTCDTSGIWQMYQDPLTGQGYAGFIPRVPLYTHGHDAREFIGTELLAPLTPGLRYYVSFYISLADGSSYGVNKIGALFTNVFLGDSVIDPVPYVNNQAQVYTNTIVTDTSNWTLISGSFEADSAYKYIVIGLFFDDAHCDTFATDTMNFWPYYYLEDICVSPDSMECKTTTRVQNIVRDDYIAIYPNPVTDLLNVQVAINSTQLSIYNSLGEVLVTTRAHKGNNTIDVSKVPNGIYFLRVEGTGLNPVKKFVVGR
jgi:hypothetical protein